MVNFSILFCKSVNNMEPTKPASSLKSFSHLSCGSLWGRISPEVTEMLVVSLPACTPQHIIRDCLALWQEHGRGDLTIPKQTLLSPPLSVQVWRAPLATCPALASPTASCQDEEWCSKALRRHGRERHPSLVTPSSTRS